MSNLASSYSRLVSNTIGQSISFSARHQVKIGVKWEQSHNFWLRKKQHFHFNNLGIDCCEKSKASISCSHLLSESDTFSLSMIANSETERAISNESFPGQVLKIIDSQMNQAEILKASIKVSISNSFLHLVTRFHSSLLSHLFKLRWKIFCTLKTMSTLNYVNWPLASLKYSYSWLCQVNPKYWRPLSLCPHPSASFWNSRDSSNSCYLARAFTEWSSSEWNRCCSH